jgi:SAM-dependent methyltransferase
MARAKFDFYQETKPFTSVRTNILEIKGLLESCASVLDIGCGRSSPLKYLDTPILTGIDAYKPDLEIAKAGATHDEFLCGDALSVLGGIRGKKFDACAAMDFIEHLTKEDGLTLIKEMERIAHKLVVVFTPNGFLPQENIRDGDYQRHLSGWSAQEMRDLGYEVIGLNGARCLRTEHQRLRFRPAIVWALISWFTQRTWCRARPASAAALLCWKIKKN